MANTKLDANLEIDTQTTEEKVAKPSASKKTAAKPAKPQRTVDDLMPNERVAIDNLADWDVGFRLSESDRGIVINGGVRNFKRLTLSEVDAQVKMGNQAFIGQDGFGTHAVFRILDPVVREYVFGEDVDPVQLTEENVRQLLAEKNKKKFNDKLFFLVVTNSEKRMIVRICEKIGVDDVPSFKLNAIERLSGIEFD